MSKAETIAFVKHQTGVELANDKTNSINSMRNVLYTQIKRADYLKVVSLLNKSGRKVESHIKDYYFIHII